MINGIFDKGAMPLLERVSQFTQERHRVLMDNVANLSTPYYQPQDLDPDAFQASLRDAIDRRRQQTNPQSGPLQVDDTDQLQFTDRRIEARPEPMNQNILFHDRNNRDLEHTMKRLAENTLVHNATIEMLRSEFSLLRLAIREQV